MCGIRVVIRSQQNVQKKNQKIRWASGGQHAKGQPPAPPTGLNYAPATASRAYIANLDILDRHGRSGYLLRPPAHAQCRHRHLGADVGSSPWPFWPARSRRGVALAHARLGPGRWASSGGHQFRVDASTRKPHANSRYFQLHFERRKGTKLPWRGTFATPRPWGHCVVLLQGLVVTGLKAWW